MLQIKNISNSPVTADETIILEMRTLFPDFDERLQDLIAGMSGCSPFLYGLVKKEQRIKALSEPELIEKGREFPGDIQLRNQLKEF